MKRFLGSLTVAAALLTIGVGVVAAQTRAATFQVGDRILLHVEGDSALSDTFTVVAGPALRHTSTVVGGRALAWPITAETALAGVVRRTLEPPLTRELGRYIKAPVL